MITFYVKFLICLMKPIPPPKKEPKGKKAALQKSPAKKGKGVKSEDVEPPINEEPEKKDDNVVFCEENAREWCHIEYSLFSDTLPVVEINVVTWGEAAKVVSKEDCRAVKTAVINDVVWVYFEVHHKTKRFSNEDVAKFKENKIKFTFSQDKKKMMLSVVSDWPKEFTFCDDWDDKEENDKGNTRWFSELRQTNPVDDKYVPSDKILENYRITRPDEVCIVTMLNVNKCEKSIEIKLKKVTATLPHAENPLTISKEKDASKKSKNIKGKKTDKKLKASQEDTSTLFVNAELLIAGKYNACAERKEITQTLRYAAVFVSSTKILTEEQDLTFAPLIVSLQTFEALPVKKIEELNVKRVFARYEFADVLDEIETPKSCPQENITVDDTRVFFLSSPEEQLEHETLMLRPSMMALAEALLTRRFVVKVYGETDVISEEVVPCIFGDRPTDPFISTPNHEMFLSYKPSFYSPETLLGSSSFNLIQLIKGYTIVEASSILTSSPLSSWDPICDLEEITKNTENEEERKALLSKYFTSGVIPEYTFLEYGSRVKLKVSTALNLTVPESLQLLNIPGVCHRAIVIFKDQSFNNEVLNIIENTNRILLQRADSGISLSPSVRFIRKVSSSRLSVLSNRLSFCINLNQTLLELRRKRAEPTMSITGFFVEHDDESILVIEAISYIIPPLIERIKLLFKSEDCVRIICDSSIFFSRRLYANFSSRDIFRIKLSESLDTLLKKPAYYTKQSMLDESLKTLLLLDLLRRCRTVNNACVNQLFPSCRQLASFSKVFAIKGSIISSLSSESSEMEVMSGVKSWSS